MVNAAVAGSDSARVSFSRMTFIACGSQHSVVRTAPVAPMRSIGNANGIVSSIGIALGLIRFCNVTAAHHATAEIEIEPCSRKLQTAHENSLVRVAARHSNAGSMAIAGV